ncbi:Map microtubule affinity-regulating kinase [Entophlyctis luteolus]|nr:Map microtubule affinity-regulating kinase [Entophlyctis luteolus]KAJ3390335.1 Map microtubule affinity-regulating kinase [Entophlyctis sp. JEL0112]
MIARKKVLGNYNVGRTVGEGAFSKVKLGVHKETGQKVLEEPAFNYLNFANTRVKVAIKIIDKKLMAQKAEKAKKAEEERRRRKEQEEYLKRNKDSGKAGGDGTRSPKNRASVISPSSPLQRAQNGFDSSPEDVDRKPPSVPEAPSFISALQLEVQLMMRLDHPNIINLYSIMETEDECYVVMEYASGGELIEYIASRNYLSEREARKFFRQIISAMDHCHLANVVHRDLKLENLLLNDKKDILISDFGLGRMYNPDNQENLKTFCGTPNYAAVELISGIPYNGMKSDIWAMGVALYVMMTGRTPFTGSSISQLYSKIKAVDYKCPDYFSGDLKNLLSKIFKKDPAKRADMETLRQDQWVNFEEFERPLRIHPRITNTSTAHITQFVSSITKMPEYTLYTIRQHTRDGLSMEGAGEESNKSVQTRRRSMSAQPALGIGGAMVPPLLVAPNKAKTTGRRFSNASNVIGMTAPVSPIQGDSISPLPSNTSIRISGTTRGRRMSLQDEQPKVPQLPKKILENPAIVKVQAESGEKRRERRSSTAFTGTFGRGHRNSNTEESADESDESMYHNYRKSASSSVSPTNVIYEDDRELIILKRMSMVSPELPTMEMVSNLPTTTAKSAGGLSQSSRSESGSIISPVQTNIPGTTITTTTTTILSEQEIEKWHEFHKPPKEIRSVRYSFNPKTTSTLAPNYIFQDIHRVLVLLQRSFPGTMIFSRVPAYYIVNCKMNYTDTEEEVAFDVEVCKMWLLNLHGVRIKKQGGSALRFKESYAAIVDMLQIN